MKLFHSHYHTLTKAHSRFVVLSLAGIMLAGLLLALVSFNLLLVGVNGEIQKLQQDLDGTLVWDSASYNVDSSLTFQNITLKNPRDSRTLFRIKNLKMSLNFSYFFEKLFADFDSMPKQRKLDYEKKSLDFLFLKSLSLIQIENLNVDIAFQEDIALIENFFATFFTKRSQPKNMDLILKETNVKIFNEGVEYSGYAERVTGILNEDKGIQVEYSVDAIVDFLTAEYTSTLSGSLNLYDLENLKSRHSLQTSDIFLNKYVFIQPLRFDFEQDNISSSLQVHGAEKQILSMKSFTEEQTSSIQSEFFSFQLGELLQLRGENQADYAGMLETNLEGAVNIEIEEEKLRYRLALNNKEAGDFTVKIDIEEDDKIIQFHSFLLEYQEQRLNWNGSLNRETWIPEGNVDLSLSETFSLAPLSTKIRFFSEDSKTYASITNFNVHGFSQSNFTIMYDSNDNSIDVFEEGKTDVILSTIFASYVNEHLGGSNVLIPADIQMFSISLNSLDLSLLDSIFFDNRNIALFSLLSLNGRVDIQIKNGQLYDLSYSIKINENDQDIFYFSSDGNYQVDDGFAIQGLFSLYENVSGSFFSEGYGQESLLLENPLLISIQTQYQDVLSVSENGAAKSYTDTFALLVKADENGMEFSIEDNLLVSVQLKEGQLHKILAQLDSFTLTGIEQIIDASLDLEINEGVVPRFSSSINVYDAKTPLFQLSSDYKDKKGTIKSLYTYAEDKTLEIDGSFVHDPIEEQFSFVLEEVSEEDRSDQRITRSSGTYDYLNNTFALSFTNMSPQLFSKNLEGNINATLEAKRDLSSVDIVVEPSEIIMVDTNTRYTVHGKTSYTPNTVEVSNLSIENSNVQFLVQEAKLEESTLRGTLVGGSKSNADSIPYIRAEIDIDMEEAFDLFYNGFSIPDFSGNVSLLPYFTDSKRIPSDYRYDMVIENKDGNYVVLERNNKLFFKRSDVGIVEGRLGNKDSAFSILISGIQKNTELGFRFDVEHLDIARIISDMSIDTQSFLVEKGNFSGPVFLRGTISEPKFYASLQSSSLSLYIPSVEQSYTAGDVFINISDNQISVSNVFFSSGDSDLMLNIKGFFDKYNIGSLQIDVVTDAEEYHNIPILNIGNVVTSGNVRGAVSIKVDARDILVSGTLYLKGTSIFLREIEDIKNELVENQRIIAVDLTLKTDTSVIFYWPNKGFPLLKSYLGQNQELRVVYDGYSNVTDLYGDLALQGGTVYYFNKGFRIKEGTIVFDTKTYEIPLIENFEATSNYRIDNQNYVVVLHTDRSFVDNIDFRTSSSPSLSEYSLSLLLGGAGSTKDENANLNSSDLSFEDVGRTIASLGDQLSNISLVSQFEQLLAQSLNLDYLSFSTKIVENLLVSTISEQRNSLNAIAQTRVLYNLIDGSYLEIGKFFQLAYLSLVFQIKEQDQERLSSRGFNSPLFLSTKINIDIPTPILDVSWSFQPSLFSVYGRNSRLLNTLSLSWGTRY